MSQMGFTVKPIMRIHLSVQQNVFEAKKGNNCGFSALRHHWENLLLFVGVGSPVFQSHSLEVI